MPPLPRILLKIAREDYDAFRALLGDDPEFPANYDLWYQVREKAIKDTISSGDTIKDVMVLPREFAGWCRRSGLTPSFSALGAFAVVKAKVGR